MSLPTQLRIPLVVFPVFSASLWLGFCARADVFFPIVGNVTPAAVQVGKEAEFQVSADNGVKEITHVLVSGTGVTGEPLPVKAGDKAPARPNVFRLKVAPDAPPGMREVRLMTPQGPSSLGNVTVVRDPVLLEQPKAHATMETAQPITLPAAVCGSVHTTEDVDYYKFTVPANTGLTFHVTAQRLQVKTTWTYYFSPILTLRNTAGTVLAASNVYYGADPLLHYRFDKAGEYFLEVRDATYRGNGRWQYCVEINDRSYVTHVHPLRVVPGTTAKLRMFGFNLPSDPTVSYAVPADLPDGLHLIPLPLPGGATTNPAPLLVSRLPSVDEADGDKSTRDKAQKITFPAGICGRLENDGEADCYAFDAIKGEKLTFQVIARDHLSPLDGLLRLYDDKGTKLLEIDDYSSRVFTHADPRIENWAAPANGRYVLELRDAQARGGTNFVYFLKAVKAEPYFLLELDTDKTLLVPGCASVIFARVVRKDGFEGEVNLQIDGLPPGVKATCGRILADKKDGAIVLEAAADAKPGVAHVRVTGTATITGLDMKPRTLSATAVPYQEIHMGGGGRWHAPVSQHAVGVCGPLDLSAVKISANAVTLKPGESKRLDVTIARADKFKGNVTLALVYQHLGQIFGDALPTGVTIDDKASFLLLTGETVKGHIVLKADAKAKPVKEQVVPVMAHLALNFALKSTFCAEPLRITVVP